MARLPVSQQVGTVQQEIKGLVLVLLRMNLNHYRDATATMCKVKGWDKTPVSIVWMLLNEEIGELASSIRQTQRYYKKTGLKKDRGQDVMMEMGDVFSYLFQLAHMLGVDLDTMWVEHQQKVRHKIYTQPAAAF
jgi:NTP pyrophosphatase (non-canonical NTP hydrolase)